MENEFDIWVVSFDGTLQTADLTGQKISAVPGTAAAAALAGSGASTVPLPGSEVLAALGTGVIDAAAGTSADFFVELALSTGGLSLYRFVVRDGTIVERVASSAEAVFGTQSGEALTGTIGDDEVYLRGGDDSFQSRGGEDVIDGGEGTDTVIFGGAAGSYTVTLSDCAVLVDDRGTTEGASRLSGVERLGFAGSDFDLTTFGGLTGLSGPELAQFIELYIAYFNRAPDAVGLGFWGTAFANGTTLEQSAAFFIDQDETRATYPEGQSNAAFATAVYDNVLGRVPDQAGFDFWVGVLDDGSVSRDQFILEVLRGTDALPPPGADSTFLEQQIADRLFLSAKTDIGTYYAVTLGMSDVANAAAAMALFNGTEASLAAALDAIDGYYTAALQPGSGAFLLPLDGVLPNPRDAPSRFDLPADSQTPVRVDLMGDGVWSTATSPLSSFARIDTVGDADWFAFEATSDSNYRIQLQSAAPGSGLDLDLRIRDESGTAVAQGVQTGDEDFEFFPADSGQFYIEVTAFADAAVLVGDYVLTVTEIA